MSQIEANLDLVKDHIPVKIQLMMDPYFEREFFTNFIFCIDRDQKVRDLFEASLRELEETGAYDDEVDRSLLHHFYAYQAANLVRESYQWLPLAQGFYSLALFRGDGRKPLPSKPGVHSKSTACQVEEFEAMIRRHARRVNSFEQAWSALLFLLENRSTRSKALGVLITQVSQESDDLTLCLLLKSIDLSFSFGWKKNALVLRRSFERFWTRPTSAPLPAQIAQATSLVSSGSLQAKASSTIEWKPDWTEGLWHRCSRESAESAWEMMTELARQGAGMDQLMTLLELYRGRLLFGMATEQWPLVTRSILRADAWRSAWRWMPEQRELYLAASLADLVNVSQKLNYQMPQRPTGESIFGTFSENLMKNQLVLRLDDAAEQGHRDEALELLALMIKDRGLSQALSDRLLLIASKQDSWTFDRTTIPVAKVITQAYQVGVQAGLTRMACGDALFGLLRFLSDQREQALLESKTRGHYDDGGLSRSCFDVSEGARIVDRYVYNELRNGQRVFVWPTEGKG